MGQWANGSQYPGPPSPHWPVPFVRKTMLVPVEWLREYTDFDLPVQELADVLTMSGLEVEEIHGGVGAEVFSTYVTPNRPDLLSVVGVAREISALLGTPFRAPKPKLTEGNTPASELAKVEILSPVNCPRYSARIILNTRVAESPQWIKDRLIAAGLRPINSVVDATNYVLLELGQPLHAFDYDLVKDHKIIVRQAEKDEKITTIDGEERALSPDTLVIADPDGAVAVAGVMGGFDSEVTEKTRNVLLESAHFNRISIRRTARSLGMSTEASYRFERWVDPSETIYALDRVAELIVLAGGGEVAKGVVDEYPGRVEPSVVRIRPERAGMVLGYEVSADDTREFLTRLGMAVGPLVDCGMDVTVPTFRPDCTLEEDLIEEVGRLYGYEKIPVKLIVGETMQGNDSEIGILSARISGILASAGLQEVVNGSMVPDDWEEDQLAIRNPLSDELNRMRRRLVPGLLSVIAYNANRGIRDVALFEIGRVFEPEEGGDLFTERLSVAGAVTGSLWGQTWNVERTSLEADFFLCKGIVENLLERLGVRGVTYRAEAVSRFHPTRTAVIEAGDHRIGVLGQVSAETASRMDLPGPTYAFELDFDLLTEVSGTAAIYTQLSRYPAVLRDLAVVVSRETPYSEIAKTIASEGGDLLENVTLFDVYTGAPLPEDKQSMAFTIVFRSRERTLRDDEVDDRLEAIRRMLAAKVGASFR